MPNRDCELQPNKIVPLFYHAIFLILKHSVLSNTHLLFHFTGFERKTYPMIIPSHVYSTEKWMNENFSYFTS